MAAECHEAFIAFALCQVAAGRTFRAGRDVRRRAARDDTTALFAAAGTHVHNVVGVADDVQVMLDDNHRRAPGHQPVEYA